MGTELEQKYLVEAARPWAVQTEVLSRLRRGGYDVVLAGEKPQEDTYYDTPEDALLLGGGSLRLRRRGGALVLTCKGPAEGGTGVFARREDERTLTGGREEALGFLREVLPEVAPDSLRETVRVENLRRTYTVTAPSGAVFELAFDDVRYVRPETEESVRERQMEAERVLGTGADLERLAEVLRGTEGLRPAEGSKYQRARRFLG